MVNYLAYIGMCLSSITDYDYVLLVSFFNASANANFNCSMCHESIKRRAKDEEMANAYYRAKGCFSGSDKPYYAFNDDSNGGLIRYYECPGNFKDYSVAYIYNLYDKYEKGILPFEGCLADQPSKVVEAFNIIVNLREDKIKKDQEKQERLNSRASRAQGRSFG